MTFKPKITDAHRNLMRKAREAWVLPHDEAKVERIQKVDDDQRSDELGALGLGECKPSTWRPKLGTKKSITP